ncbi:hypothetical protein ACIO3O_11455 [Streptomyces sp. NPDC087440]|uniref:hypothetical protein n=1 Tax=Streptomyces sp. NPDC087440 TaxID=3365790 RepID=UPI0038288426
MRRGRLRRRAPAAGALAALLLAGCGIRETDVIEAGGPATVDSYAQHGVDALLFFRQPSGELAPVLRPMGRLGSSAEHFEPQPAAADKILTALIAGPNRTERAAGFTSALPAARTPDRFSVAGPGSGAGEGPRADDITVSLPFGVDELDPTGVRQLICTAAYGEEREGRSNVVLTGTDGKVTEGTCDMDPRTEP